MKTTLHNLWGFPLSGFRMYLTAGLALSIALILCIQSPVSSDDTNPFEKPILMGRTELPKLPRSIRRSMAKGIIMVKAQVNDRGIVTTVDPIRSTGNDSLDEFVIEWVKEWTFIPKIMDEESMDSFTILTIRYDLSRNLFEAPLPLNIPAQIPAAVILKMGAPEEDSQFTGPTPLEPLTVPAIPLEIQKLNISGETRLNLTVDQSGSVTAVGNIPEKPLNPQLKAWLAEYIITTKWDLSTLENPSSTTRIELPLKYNTAICKFSFGDAVFRKQ